jgi:tetratricopeptide (TPR) repeat protein
MWTLSQSVVIRLVTVCLYMILSQARIAEAVDESLQIKKQLEDKYRNAVVHLSTWATDFMGQQSLHQGSGFVISQNGYVITASHVIPLVCGKNDKKIGVTAPCYKERGKTKIRMGTIKLNEKDALDATVKQQDPTVDLALLKIDNPPVNIKKVPLGDPKGVQKYQDVFYMAGFPAPEDFLIIKGEIHDFSSTLKGKSNRWVALLDAIWGDSGGPVFFQNQVMAVMQGGILGSPKNKYLAPLILADRYLEEAGVWKPWMGKENVTKALASRDKTVTGSITLEMTKDIPISHTKEEELFAVRERQNNQDDSAREYRYQLFRVGVALESMRTRFEERHQAQNLVQAQGALSLGDIGPATHLLHEVALTGDEYASEACYQLGSLAEINIDYESALDWYKQALQKPKPKAIYFDAAAEMAYKLGDRENMLQWALKSVELRKGDVGKEDPGYAISLCRLGEFIVESDPETTIKNCVEALVILERYPGQELEIAEVNDNLGAAYRFKGDYSSKPEEAYQRAMNLSERIAVLTKDVRAQKIFGNSNNNLANLYRSMGRYRDSLPFAKEAISVNEGVFGENHPRLGIDRTGLAVLQRVFGNYSEADKQFREARRLLTSAMGRKNRLVGVVLYNMASLAQILKKNDEAVRMASEAVKIFEDVFGKENSVHEMRANLVLAEIKSIQGKHSEAKHNLERAEAMNRSKFASRKDDTFRILLLGASLCIRQSQFDEADTLVTKAKAISQELGYQNNSLMGEMSLIKGKVYSGTKKFIDAEKEFEKAQQLFSTDLGLHHPKRAAALTELAQVQTSLNKLKASDSTAALATKIFALYPDVQVVTLVDL